MFKCLKLNLLSYALPAQRPKGKKVFKKPTSISYTTLETFQLLDLFYWGGGRGVEHKPKTNTQTNKNHQQKQLRNFAEKLILYF